MAHLEKSDEFKAMIPRRLISESESENQNLLSGGIAQLVERLPCTQEVSGSSPLTSTLTSYLTRKTIKKEQRNQHPDYSKKVGMLESITLVRTLKTA
jgi:hypothetical protein